MAPTNGFRDALQAKKPLLGTINALPSPEITELLVLAGFDWLWIDMEHSPMDVLTMQRILQAGQKGCPCVVRAPSHDEFWFKKILDAGADGIIVPQLKTPQDAEKIIGFCKYPPEGARSVGISRAHGYGLHFKQQVEEANKNVALIFQVEHIDAVNNIEAIVAVPGIDAIIIGPYDLSGSMGKIGQVNDPDVRRQIDKTRDACLEAGLPVGIFTVNPQDVEPLMKQGYTLVAWGIDSMILGQALTQGIREAKKG